jgi:hypothetical protein
MAELTKQVVDALAVNPAGGDHFVWDSVVTGP